MSRLSNGSVFVLRFLMLCRLMTHLDVILLIFLLSSNITILSVSWQNFWFSSSLILHVCSRSCVKFFPFHGLLLLFFLCYFLCTLMGVLMPFSCQINGVYFSRTLCYILQPFLFFQFDFATIYLCRHYLLGSTLVWFFLLRCRDGLYYLWWWGFGSICWEF